MNIGEPSKHLCRASFKVQDGAYRKKKKKKEEIGGEKNANH